MDNSIRNGILAALSCTLLCSCEINHIWYDRCVSVASDKVSEPLIYDDDSAGDNSPIMTSVSEAVNSASGGYDMIDVPYYPQDKLPTGCELYSSSMILAYYGIFLSPEEIFFKYIPSCELWTDSNGQLVGEDPDSYFIGDPYSEYGYGCYSGVILNFFEQCLPEYDLSAHDLRGTPLDDLCESYISRGIPVMVWASIGMEQTEKKENNCWIIPETGEYFTWTSGEHCLVLVGSDDENYYFNDPLDGAYVPYDKELSEKRYEELGMQAIAIMR